MSAKARILFVDDEKRVLNSMRGLFRRDYELYLTTVGADAVTMASENDVDVVIADQRMPGMTGIEVLGAIKKTSPRTVRILLTGYADPSAVEGSINIGEVFRFLSKPCPPNLLRETLTLAIDAARTQPVIPPGAAEPARRSAAAAPLPEVPVPAAGAPLQKPPLPTADAFAHQATGIGYPAEPAAPPQPGQSAATETRDIPAANVTGEQPVVETSSPPTTAMAATSDPRISQDLGQDEPPASGASEPPAGKVAEPHAPVATEVKEASEPPRAEFTAPTKPASPEIMESNEPRASSERKDNDATEPAMPALDLDEMRAREAAEKTDSSHWHSVTNVVLSEDTVEETQDNVVLPAGITKSIKDVSVVVFTVDSEFAEMAMRALSGDRNAILATSLVKVAQAVEAHQAGVLVTDFTTNSGVLQKMIGALKQHMPELVTIVVSSGRDTTDMINLINYGQVFRYILKPIEASDLKTDVNAAAVRCLYLLSNPESVKRHRVIEAPSPTDSSSTLNRFLGRIRKMQSERPDSTDLVSK